jgi:hypothetical protein
MARHTFAFFNRQRWQALRTRLLTLCCTSSGFGLQELMTIKSKMLRFYEGQWNREGLGVLGCSEVMALL